MKDTTRNTAEINRKNGAEHLETIENLTNEQLPPKTTPDQLRTWWKQNEQKFTLPSREETDMIDIPALE